MKKRHKSDYHLLVTHNFLSNISRVGTHEDTKLKIFNEIKSNRAYNNGVGDSTPLGINDEDKEDHLVMQCQRNLRDYYSEGYYDRMIAAEARSINKKKPSLFRRFIKIISMDEFFGFRSNSTESLSANGSESSESEHYGSMVSLETMDNIKPFRTHLPKCNRDYLCDVTNELPLVVVSNMVFRTEGRKRFRQSRSLLFLGDRRRNHSSCSVDELKPYCFINNRHEKIEYAFSELLGKRRGISPGNIRQPSRRDSQTMRVPTSARSHSQDFLDATVYSNQENDDQYWDEISAEPYNPWSLEEVEQLRKTIIKSPGYVGVTYHYSTKGERKLNLNEKFAQKFPRVNLTYSKFKSIKNDVILLARECKIDLMTISHGFVFFERIVTKGLISKHNRKMVAGAALLVSVKLNDYSKENIKRVIQNIVEKLRISRKELLSLELPLCVGLQFDLYPPKEHILPHFERYCFEEM